MIPWPSWNTPTRLTEVGASFLPIPPADPAGRALAHSLCAEMHAGFPNLRENLPMNLGRQPASHPVNEQTEVEISRILSMWEGLLNQDAPGGPYLFRCVEHGRLHASSRGHPVQDLWGRSRRISPLVRFRGSAVFLSSLLRNGRRMRNRKRPCPITSCSAQPPY